MKHPIIIRVGWLQYYDITRDGGALPQRGGSYNKEHIGSELENFRTYRGKLYGYGQTPRNGGFNANQVGITPDTRGAMHGALVVFISTHETGGQRVIGWYRNATLLKGSRERPAKWYGLYNIVAPRNDAVLLPSSARTLKLPAAGKGNPGTSNVFYPLDEHGRPRKAPWLRGIISYVDGYRGKNLLDEGSKDEPTDDPCVQRTRGQGFGSTKRERDLVEAHAMRMAIQYFERSHYEVHDVHSGNPYDLVCYRRGEVLYVEVKGTTGPGESVIVTHGEVVFARRMETALFVVSNIEIHGSTTSGGDTQCVNPWKPAASRLHPVQYRHIMPGKRHSAR